MNFFKRNKIIGVDEFIKLRRAKTRLFGQLFQFIKDKYEKGNLEHLFANTHIRVYMAAGHFDQILISRCNQICNKDKASNKKLFEDEKSFYENTDIKKLDFKDYLPTINEILDLSRPLIKGKSNIWIEAHSPPMRTNLTESSWCVDYIYRKLKEEKRNEG